MHLLRSVQQIVHRQRKQRRDSVDRPSRARLAARAAIDYRDWLHRAARWLQWVPVSGRVIPLSNFLTGAFDRALGRARRGAIGAARRALPQRCEQATEIS